MRRRCRCGRAGRNTLGPADDTPAATAAFTIVEVIVVMAIILVLAGLILGTSGYVHNKAARSRAEAEIAAMSAALENYKADNGVYPSDSTTTELVKPNADPQGGNPINFVDSGKLLYKRLSGDSDGDPTNGIESRSYFGTALKPNMLSPNPPGVNTYIHDPFRYCYGYSTIKSANPSGTDGYNPTFDLWSTAGEIGKKPAETFANYQQRWLKNW